MSVTAAHFDASRTSADPGVAASRLFSEQFELILGYCLRQLGSRAEAEDAAQTTFLHAFRALRRGVVPECEAAWLTTIAKNVCHTQRRTVERRGSLASDLDLDTIAIAEPGEDEEELLLGFKAALESMPEKQRRALVLREWRGVGTPEIAGELGLSTTATHALLTRARQSFAQALTLPRRPVVGIAWLLVELRSHVKALFGGISTKAAAASIAVVGVGVGAGGIAVEKSLADSKAPVAPVRSTDQAAAESGARAPTVRVTSLSNGASRAGTAGARGPARKTPLPGSGLLDSTAVSTANPPLAGDPEQTPVPGAGPSPPSEVPLDVPVELPVEKAPQLPKVELPTQLVPPVAVPPLPPAEIPTPPTLPSPSEAPPVPSFPLP